MIAQQYLLAAGRSRFARRLCFNCTTPIPGSEGELPADLVLFAMGFSGPVETDVIKELQLPVVARGRFRGLDANDKDYRVKGHKKPFAAGDIRHARASSCGPSAKAARPPTPSTASSWARATCQGRRL